MPFQHERILSGIMGKGEIVGFGTTFQRRFAVLTEEKLAFAAFQGVAYAGSSFPENYPITIGMAKEKFDEFDVEKKGLLTLDAARKCLDSLNKNKADVMLPDSALPGAPGSIPQNGARADNPGTECGIQHNLCHVTYSYVLYEYRISNIVIHHVCDIHVTKAFIYI
jgi:hypothetical protein